MKRDSVRWYGERWLKWRARTGLRSVATDRDRWRSYVETAPWIDRPISSVTRADASAWLKGMLVRKNQRARSRSRRLLAAQTVKNALNLVRGFFESALQDGHIVDNPFAGWRVPRTRSATTADKWTVLRKDEQERLLAAIPTPERHIVAFAMGTGLRRMEQWCLRGSDVVVEGENPHIVVRFGEHGPTKGGRPRRVPLFGLALEAARAWLEQLPTYAPKNRNKLMFPTPGGGRREEPPRKNFAHWLKKAHVTRHVRWHDLRHTCAASLVAGWWGTGRRWSLRDVQLLLGHRSITTTERYVHFIEDPLFRAADETDPSRGAA